MAKPEEKTTVEIRKPEHREMLALARKRKSQDGIPHHVTYAAIVRAGIAALKGAK